MLKGHAQTPKTRERISRGLYRYHERQRVLAKTQPRDLTRLERSGTVTPALRPLLAIAAEESAEIVDALGGATQVTPQQRALVEDLAAAGIALRATLALFLQGVKGDHAARIGALVSVRRASLIALGLDRVANEVPDLATYMRQLDAQKDARATNGDASDAEVVEPQNAAESATSNADSRVVAPEARDNGDGMGSGSACPTRAAVNADESETPC